MRILHCHSTFSAGGKERRAVQLMNAFGSSVAHTIVSGMPDQMGARDLIDPQIKAAFPAEFPSLSGRPTPRRLARLARAMQGFDLILTYNWGAMDAVMAHAVFVSRLGLPPLIHHEDGFNQDEAEGLKPMRNWYRRAALRGVHSLVVPSGVLEQIALGTWRQPAGKVVRIPNGIDTAAFASKPDPNALPMTKGTDERWVGTMAGLRPVKRLPALVEAFKGLPANWRLVIVGEGPEHAEILAAAARWGCADRVHLPGAVADPAKVVGLFDIFALSSDSEQFPLSVVEAMAAGLPVASPAVGDVASIVALENAQYTTPPGDIGALGAALAGLAKDADMRAAIGTANQRKAQEQFGKEAMIERYRRLYEDAAGRAF